MTTLVFTIDPIIVIVATYSIALLFLFASFAKLSALSEFAATLADYDLVPPSLVDVTAKLIVGIELGIFCGAIYPPTAQWSMAVAGLLLLLYAFAIGVNLVRGRREIDCGCMGPARRQAVSGWLVLRNVALATAASFGTLPVASRALQTADFVLICLALLSAITVYAAINQLMANAPYLNALDANMGEQ